jgi:hypothetical protein
MTRSRPPEGARWPTGGKVAADSWHSVSRFGGCRGPGCRPGTLPGVTHPPGGIVRICTGRPRLVRPGAISESSSQGGTAVLAITVRDRSAGIGGLSVTHVPYPDVAENDVVGRVHAAGFTPGELSWPGTWSDRAGRDRTPSMPRTRAIGRRCRARLRDHRPHGRPARVRADRLDPQRLAS